MDIGLTEEELKTELGKIKALEYLIRGGYINTASIGAIRPFRLSTVQEMISLRVVVEDESNLRQSNNEFIENPWGFPFIPVPNWNVADREKRMRLAPKRVSFEWIGHPIYWIDPKLTKLRENEKKDPARWAVRMYYLILAFGLFDINGHEVKWVNALKARGVDYTKEEWENYARGYDTEFEEVYYGTKDLKVPISMVEESYQAALKHIARIQKRELDQFTARRAVAFKEGVSIIRETSSNNSPIKRALGEATALTKAIAKIVTEGAVVRYKGETVSSVSQLVDPLFSNVRTVIALIKQLDSRALILSAPVIRESTISRLQYSAIATSLANYHAFTVPEQIESKLNRLAQDLANANDSWGPEEFGRYQTAVRKELDNSWGKVQLALANYQRVENGLPPFANAYEMKAYDESKKGA